MDGRIVTEIFNFFMMLMSLVLIMTVGFFMYQLSQLDSYQHTVNAVIERSGNITPLAYARLNYVAKRDYNSGGSNNIISNTHGEFGPPIPTGGSQFMYRGGIHPANGGFGIHAGTDGNSNYKSFGLPRTLIADSPDDYTASDLPSRGNNLATLPSRDYLNNFSLIRSSSPVKGGKDLLVGGGVLGNKYINHTLKEPYMAYPTMPRDYGQRVGYVIPVRFHIGIPGVYTMFLKLGPTYRYGEATSQVRPLYNENDTPNQQSSGTPVTPNRGENGSANARKTADAKYSKDQALDVIHECCDDIAQQLNKYRTGQQSSGDTNSKVYLDYDSIGSHIVSQNMKYVGTNYTFTGKTQDYIHVPGYGSWDDITNRFPFLRNISSQGLS